MIMTTLRGRPSIYPWTRWMHKALKAPPLRIVKGEDFNCEMKAMDVMVRQYAGRKNLSASIKTEGKVMSISYKRRNERKK